MCSSSMIRSLRWSLRRTALAGSILLCACGLLLFALLWPRCSGQSCPSAEALKRYSPPQATLVFDRNGGLLARLAPQQRLVVPLSAIPPRVSGAFLAVEDRRFYQHHGVDWHRALGALWHDLRAFRAREGFSTITMQLARNVFPEHLTRARTLRRKLAEVLLAREIEASFSKEQILELYLNQIYLGNGLYGIEAAARGYFGRPVGELTHAQAAMLAALPKAPALYDPRRDAKAARGRRDLVLGMMADAGVISAQEMKSARKDPLKLAPLEPPAEEAPYFVAAVRRELRDRFGSDADTLGLRVRTPLDLGLQRSAERELRRQIALVETGKLGKFPGRSCAGLKPADPAECLQGMFAALDPATGDVMALVGGRDYALSEFDRATQARRQAGSTFKAFVWAAAIEAGIPLSTLLSPEPALPDEYVPADHLSGPPRPLNLREGLRVSSNRAAVALGARVGAPRIIETARKLGIATPLRDYPSLFLGAADVEPLELTAAFAPFANGGFRVKPRIVLEVQSAAGATLYRAPLESSQALAPGVAYLMASLLADVVDRGTGVAAREQGLPPEVAAAGKTGTTNEAQDVWFVGATQDLVAGVWLGFDRPRPLGPNASGGRLAAPVWGKVLREFYRGRPPPPPWPRPAEVVERAVDSSSGTLAVAGCPREQVAPELFLAGALPPECPEHHGGITGFFERIGRIFSR